MSPAENGICSSYNRHDGHDEDDGGYDGVEDDDGGPGGIIMPGNESSREWNLLNAHLTMMVLVVMMMMMTVVVVMMVMMMMVELVDVMLVMSLVEKRICSTVQSFIMKMSVTKLTKPGKAFKKKRS